MHREPAGNTSILAGRVPAARGLTTPTGRASTRAGTTLLAAHRRLV